MLEELSPLTRIRQAIVTNRLTPVEVARTAARHANSNASRNTYIRFDAGELEKQAQDLSQCFPAPAAKPPLFGIPISLKDCFDLAGTRTTCGSHYYAQNHPTATRDAAIAQSLRNAGALITGKTHLHPLAYGITGENRDYGNCLQPRDKSLLTGGSSSGAAASVQEGSALAAIGTDTGGSIRVPAALCGLTGFRASHLLASSPSRDTGGWFPDAWQGAAHLAPSFDTLGLLLRDPRDAAPLAQALFNIPIGTALARPRIGIVPESFLADCQPDVHAGFQAWQDQLIAMGAHIEPIDTTPWRDTLEIFAGIQAHEAAAIHRGTFDHYDTAIRDRLHWGASLTQEALAELQQRAHAFNTGILRLFQNFDLLMLPAAPVSRLDADADHADARRIILRYTTPFSLAGLPALSLPGELIGAPFGTGIQLAAAPANDPMLLAWAGAIGQQMKRM